MKSRWLLPIAVVALLSAGVDTGLAQERPWHDEGDPGAREEYYYGTRAYPFGKIPQSARLNALMYAEMKMARYGDRGSGIQSASRWRQIGPFDLGGRINSIAVHPTDGRTLWIGTADGGVWRSTDRGESWMPMMDNENAIAMGAVAVDPSNPDILYAGTGEAADVVDAYNGAGIFKSTDGGQTWRSVGLTSVAAFSRIAVHPRNGNIVFAAAIRNNAGLYRSSDAGATWTRVLGRPVHDITINRANPDELWIGGGLDAVSHSTDAGLTFTPSAEGLAVDGAYIGRVSVQVAPSNPSVLYALAQVARFSLEEETRIFKSTDRGATWRSVYDVNILSYYGFPQGGFNNVIAVKPDNSSVVFAGGVLVAYTRDGGNNWLLNLNQTLHPDYHAIAFDPTNPDRLYIGNDGGMYRSDDAGVTFTRISKGLAVTQFYAMAIDLSLPDLTYGGTQDNGTVTNSAADYWEGAEGVIAGGDGFFTIVNRDTPTVLYHEHIYGTISRTDLTTRTTTLYMQGLDPSNEEDRAAWSAPLVMDPKRSDILYCGRQRLYRRTAQSVWTPISPVFRTPLSAIGISPVDTRIIYAGSGFFTGASYVLLNNGTPLGELRVSTDNGDTWTDRSTGTGLPNRIITEILPSPNDACTAYIAYSGFHSGHIFKTTDCGAHWADISLGLPDIPVNALALHPDDERIIYAGSDIGIFVTTDGGANWALYNNGLPKVAVVDLAVHPTRRVVRAATHGRSMWEIDIERPAVAPSITIPSGREVWIGNTSRTIVWSGFDGTVRIDYSLDDGATWRTIADNVSGSSYQWEVVNAATVMARIRVIAVNDTAVRAVSSSFTIDPYHAGALVSYSTKPFGTWGLSFDGSQLWGTVERGDTLMKFDPTTLATLGSVRLSFATDSSLFSDITYNRRTGTIFLHDVTTAFSQGIGWLCEVDTSGQLLHRWKSPCAYPTGLVWIDEGDGNGRLLASDLLGEQNFYLLDADDGSVLRTIPPVAHVEFGPSGLAAADDSGHVWQVIAGFDPDYGPLEARAVLRSLDAGSEACATRLAVSSDSAWAGAYLQWGKISARGIERNPRNGYLWVTGIDGSIYTLIPCEATTSGVEIHQRAGREGSAGLLTIAPNPSHGDVRVTVNLVREAHLRVAFYDMEGRVVALPIDAVLSVGEHHRTLQLHGLASGVYVCRLFIDGVSDNVRPVVLIR